MDKTPDLLLPRKHQKHTLHFRACPPLAAMYIHGSAAVLKGAGGLEQQTGYWVMINTSLFFVKFCDFVFLWQNLFLSLTFEVSNPRRLRTRFLPVKLVISDTCSLTPPTHNLHPSRTPLHNIEGRRPWPQTFLPKKKTLCDSPPTGRWF